MDKKNLKGKDLFLAFLYTSGIGNDYNEPIIGRTRLQKMMYVFEKEALKNFNKLDQSSLPNFEPYLYGPFSKELLDDIKFFESIGFIKSEETNIPISQSDKIEYNYAKENQEDNWDDATFDDSCDNEMEQKYFLSKTGIKYVVENIWNDFTQEQQNYLKLFKSKINSLTLYDLLKYVYNKYPESTINSIVKKKYLEN